MPGTLVYRDESLSSYPSTRVFDPSLTGVLLGWSGTLYPGPGVWHFHVSPLGAMTCVLCRHTWKGDWVWLGLTFCKLNTEAVAKAGFRHCYGAACLY